MTTKKMMTNGDDNGGDNDGDGDWVPQNEPTALVGIFASNY